MILRISVVIPIFDNSRTISEVVKDVLLSSSFPVLIVDDGSQNPVANSLYSWDVRKAIESGRVRVERFEKNQGKGAALRFAIHKLASEGYTHMLTMDGDGQHFAREIHKLVDLAKAHPWDLIVGVRKLQSETVPGISKFGRKFSNFWVRYETGLRVQDSQSGFRLYPLQPVQMQKFVCTQYDFEIEVLIRLLWKGVQVREVEIDVHYPKPSERVSHFHKFWDNFRISCLNIILVSLSLFRSRTKPLELALAAGVGVFIGCTPLFGFHTLIAIGVSLLFRLNLVALWLGTHISMPLLAPILILSEVRVGQWFLGAPAKEGVATSLREWGTGSLLTGLILGTLTFALVLSASGLVHLRNRTVNWSGRTRGTKLGNGILKLVLQHLGLKTGYFCLRCLVPYFYIFAPRSLIGMNEYWRLVSPRDSFFKRQRNILKHYYKFGQVLMDRVYQSFHTSAQFKSISDGIENIQKSLENGKGLILLSGHMGGWDLSAALLGDAGLKQKIRVVEFKADGLTFQNIKNDAATRVDTNKDSQAVFSIHAALRAGEAIGCMGDRPIGPRFELLPLLGRLVAIDMTAFRLAAALEVPLILTFGFKATAERYDFFARPPRYFAFDTTRSRELQCVEWAREYVAEIERCIKKYPDQWFNFYPFWSSLPTSPNGEIEIATKNSLAEDLDTPMSLKPVSVSDPKPIGAAEHKRWPMRSERSESHEEFSEI
jgi:predicted LPLAT superfamily acyltransferase/uncharacterized protein (DUF2062 family)